MAGVAKRNAATVSGPVVMRELFLLPDAERRLFAGIDTTTRPGVELEASFDIEAGAAAARETISVRGTLAAGHKTVRLSYDNDYYGGPGRDRNVRLDRLDVRNAAGRVVSSRELEQLEPIGPELATAVRCNSPGDDHFAIRCNGTLDVPIDVPAAGDYTVEIVAWANQAGDELPRLTVAVESTPKEPLAPWPSGASSSSCTRSCWGFRSRPTRRTSRPRTGSSST